MTVMLGKGILHGILGMREAIDLLEKAAIHEAKGQVLVSPRLHTTFKSGWMRILFAVDEEVGYFATKAYHRIEGVGVRYLISLYRLEDGDLVALLDGQGITELRTGAASGVVARRVKISGPVSVGIIGSSSQARAQLRSLATVYQIDSAMVYSPTTTNRETFARDMSGELGFRVLAVDTAEAAIRGRSVVATASSHRSKTPVVFGEWLEGCRLLCAVGNTRAQFVEADSRCFFNAKVVVVDSINAVEETGELLEAKRNQALAEGKCATLAQIISGDVVLPTEGLITFKSVGTALQDLALATRYYELLGNNANVPNVSGLASLRSK